MPPKPQNTQPPAPQEDAVITVRVLSAVTIGAVRYQPNTVLTLSSVLAKQHAVALDDHPDAIAMALADGGAERTHGEV